MPLDRVALADVLLSLKKSVETVRHDLLAREGVILEGFIRTEMDPALLRELQSADILTQILDDIARILGACAGDLPKDGPSIGADILLCSIRLEKVRAAMLGEHLHVPASAGVELF
ncbi:hypothetical protein [Wenxinia saemankumensis]|uniref:Uncharacterized protein n=1 Tax=Wenxinia saemankumensis TaxID=1447782 RepID=A0A1M6DQJ2_9RHOB|nr:hypothetical protein [Wenxinia saemankumensis]SHI75465.1 hypothetical protein SAMN05444417_1549 [Wenxinia saemankumensis]